jgi:hypothetical protein
MKTASIEGSLVPLKITQKDGEVDIVWGCPTCNLILDSKGANNPKESKWEKLFAKYTGIIVRAGMFIGVLAFFIGALLILGNYIKQI